MDEIIQALKAYNDKFRDDDDWDNDWYGHLEIYGSGVIIFHDESDKPNILFQSSSDILPWLRFLVENNISATKYHLISVLPGQSPYQP